MSDFSSERQTKESLCAESENFDEHYVPDNLPLVDSELIENVPVYEFAVIDDVTGVSTQAINETLTPGGQFIVSGHKIKVAGDKPEVGVYFVSAADPSQRVKVAGHLAKNTETLVSGIIPALSAGRWKLEIVTQYSSMDNFLKEPRTITLAYELTIMDGKPIG